MRIACVYVPDFPVAAVMRAAPEICSRAVAVLEGKPPLTKVIATNQSARQKGIASGMTLLQAEACPAIQLRWRSPAQETAAHAALLDCAHALSPTVEDAVADTVFIDLAGLEHLFGSPQKIARQLADACSQVGLETQVAVAQNPDAALHAARGFAGITVIEAGAEAERLGGLPVEILQPPPEILEIFDRWGVHSFHDLAALPPLALSQRLGQAGLQLQRKARGITNRDLVPLQPTLQFVESLELESPVALLEPLAFLLARLLEQICARLAMRSLATNELHLTLQLDPSASEEATAAPAQCTHERAIKLPVPILDSKVFLKLLQLDLQEHPPQAPIVKITLEAEAARPRVAQNGLFASATLPPERLELTLARIAGVVGRERLGQAQLLDSHSPDAFVMQPFGHNQKEHKPPPRRRVMAMRRFRPPVAARVSLRRGTPHTLAFRGTRYQVINAAGPWRSSGGWWSPNSWAREEWDLALRPAASSSGKKWDENAGVLCRVFQDSESRRWFVEGSYD